MIAPANWRRSHLSSTAAAHLRESLDGVLHALEGAQIERVLDRLTGWRWRDDAHPAWDFVTEVHGRGAHIGGPFTGQ